MNEIIQIPLNQIRVGIRKRALNPEKVKELAESIKVSGLLQPILLTHEKRLVHGHHRLAAARLLGWESIQAMIETMSDLEAELAEIDENLYRSELTVLERAELLLRRDEILRERGLRAEPGDNQHARGGETNSPPPKTTREMASEIGLGERSAQMYLQIARDISPEVRDVLRETDFADKTTELLALARIKDKADQKKVAERLLAGECLSVTSAARSLSMAEKRRVEVIEAIRQGRSPEVNILVGDALEMLKTLPDASVHCLVTSPPYYGLREYGTATWEGGDADCDHTPEVTPRSERPRGGLTGGMDYLEAQQPVYRESCQKCGARRIDKGIGLESSVEEWIEKLVLVFREARRVLRPDATAWINIGDSYAGGQTRQAFGDMSKKWMADGRHGGRKLLAPGLKQKDLLGQPWLLATALRDDGWWLRAEIVWQKPNPLPESITDRPTKAHEMVFLLAKSDRYFYDRHAVLEEMSTPPEEIIARIKRARRETAIPEEVLRLERFAESEPYAPSGRNLRSVWTIPTFGFPGAHFATYPPRLVEICVQAGTSAAGCCARCGAPWERVTEPTREYEEILAEARESNAYSTERRKDVLKLGVAFGDKPTAATASYETRGWRPGCGCSAGDPVPCTVIDPFLGSGTSCLVSHKLGRSSIGIELNPKYAEMARKRIFGETSPKESA